eukprot:CAMPEP_0196665334 /NCGR_PEP_ID=MMETSP1086-20130531/60597_1 /TAXON_ID=77921 /ORGANISM="Cyanoptyche  gloeocystis , Strain SAG4.97" /LENGTH=68 /DNA_ID=CAMNT_0042002049 /DNA_START=146 /DNA_END=352 /DNA_ORIENTATION=+
METIAHYIAKLEPGPTTMTKFENGWRQQEIAGYDLITVLDQMQQRQFAGQASCSSSKANVGERSDGGR